MLNLGDLHAKVAAGGRLDRRGCRLIPDRNRLPPRSHALDVVAPIRSWRQDVFSDDSKRLRQLHGVLAERSTVVDFPGSCQAWGTGWAFRAPLVTKVIARPSSSWHSVYLAAVRPVPLCQSVGVGESEDG